MNFIQDKGAERIGFILGYAASYILFTALLFFVLAFSNRLHAWNYLNFMLVTVIIATSGLILKRLLR